MKKNVILLFSFFYSFSFGQKDLSGVYYGSSGGKIEIKGNEFYFIVPSYCVSVYSNDTLAKCTLKLVDFNLIELNSVPAYVIAHQGLKVEKFYDSTIKDSIKISFSIPYNWHNLEILVFTDTNKTFRLNYSSNNKELFLPRNTRTIDFSISPVMYTPHSPDGLYFGVLYYPSVEYTIENKYNHISIDIPSIDNAFFERYYIKGEYAKVSNDTIIWKGKIFIKQK